MITELAVPRALFEPSLAMLAGELRARRADLIYGMVRLIEREDEAFLSCAREDQACAVLNLHVPHTPNGVADAATTFRGLIDVALRFGGTSGIALSAMQFGDDGTFSPYNSSGFPGQLLADLGFGRVPPQAAPSGTRDDHLPDPSGTVSVERLAEHDSDALLVLGFVTPDEIARVRAIPTFSTLGASTPMSRNWPS